MDRPALQRLLRDAESGRVDCIVLYRLDRLCRSIVDFGRIVEILDRHEVAFVSVTEQFSTATPTGRLHLNMLLSFAQYEREIIAERIRDKVAAAKRRGKYTGGLPILGYDVDRELKKLVVNPEEAKLVVRIFKRVTQLGSVTKLAAELNRGGHRTKSWVTKTGKTQGGRRWNKPHIYRLLNNHTYLGEVAHRGTFYHGEHEAIVSRALWDDVQRIFTENARVRANRTRAKTPALLKGIIKCGHCSGAMTPSSTKKRGKTYRYYLCLHAAKNGHALCPVRSVASGEIEEAVVGQLRAVFRTPEIVARTFREAKTRESEELARLRGEKAELEERLRRLQEALTHLIEANGNDSGSLADELRRTGNEMDEVKGRLETVTTELQGLESSALTERDVIDALERLDPVWEELFPAEQTRIVQLLVERVEVQTEGIELRLRCEGLRSLVSEIGAEEDQVQKGARAG